MSLEISLSPILGDELQILSEDSLAKDQISQLACVSANSLKFMIILI